MFKFRNACITWADINLDFAELNDLMFPKNHIFLLKMIQFMLSPSHSTFLLAEKNDIFTSVISVFIRQ